MILVEFNFSQSENQVAVFVRFRSGQKTAYYFPSLNLAFKFANTLDYEKVSSFDVYNLVQSCSVVVIE